MSPHAATGVKHEDAPKDDVISLLRPSLMGVTAPVATAPVATPQDAAIVGALEAQPIKTPIRAAWWTIVHRHLLGLADTAASAAAMVLVLSLFGKPGIPRLTLAIAPLVLVLFKVSGLYDRDDLRLGRSTLDETPLLLQLTGLSVLGMTVLSPMLVTHSRLSGTLIAALWLASFSAVALGRVLIRGIGQQLSPVERCLVIGDFARSHQIREKLAAGRVHARIIACLPLMGAEAAQLGDTAAMRRLVDELGIERIIIASDSDEADGVVELVRAAKHLGVRVSVLLRMFDAVGRGAHFDEIDGMTLLGLRQFGMSRSARLLKRSFDLAATSAGLLAVAPLMTMIAVAIRLDSRGPILFRQIRVGRDGRPFMILKFRSMVVDAESRKDDLRSRNEAGDGLFKITDDPRVTRVGRFLRSSSLDELPQLLNVLRGEMSLVGPRPLVTDEDARVRGLDRSRLHLTPGITGPWQILGRRVPLQEMVGIDYLYVANWSLWADLKILLRTAGHVLRRGNL